MTSSKNSSFIFKFMVGAFLVAELVFGATGCQHDQIAQYNKDTAILIKRNKAVKEAVTQALATNTDVNVLEYRLFEERWPCNQHLGFGWNKDKELFEGKAGIVTGISDRYRLLLVLDFTVSPDYKTVKFISLMVNFSEIAKLTPTSGGGYSITFNTASDQWFGIEKLRVLREADWDFAKIGIVIKTNAPVEHFQEIVPRL